MIDTSALPTWQEIFLRIGEKAPRGKRARCPIHDGDSLTSLAFDEDKGVFYCHVCHAAGDKIGFLRQLYKCDFKEALRFFGLEPGKPPAPDPQVIKQRRMREGLKVWTRTTGRKLRDEYYTNEKLITKATERLKKDPEDSQAWELLAAALPGQAEREHYLDLLNGTEEQQLTIYRTWRKE